MTTKTEPGTDQIIAALIRRLEEQAVQIANANAEPVALAWTTVLEARIAEAQALLVKGMDAIRTWDAQDTTDETETLLKDVRGLIIDALAALER